MSHPVRALTDEEMKRTLQDLGPQVLLDMGQSLSRHNSRKDYQALAEKMGYSRQELDSCIPRGSDNPGYELLMNWSTGGPNRTLRVLATRLEQLGRYDVLKQLVGALDVKVTLLARLFRDDKDTGGDHMEIEAVAWTRLGDALEPELRKMNVRLQDLDITAWRHGQGDFLSQPVSRFLKDELNLYMGNKGLWRRTDPTGGSERAPVPPRSASDGLAIGMVTKEKNNSKATYAEIQDHNQDPVSPARTSGAGTTYGARRIPEGEEAIYGNSNPSVFYIPGYRHDITSLEQCIEVLKPHRHSDGYYVFRPTHTPGAILSLGVTYGNKMKHYRVKETELERDGYSSAMYNVGDCPRLAHSMEDLIRYHETNSVSKTERVLLLHPL